MKTFKKFTVTLCTLLIASSAFAGGKIQNEDVKSLAELTGAGATAAQLINDTKIYVSAGGINQQLSSAITSGLIGGGGTNYVAQGNMEGSISSFITYADTAGVMPVACSGGSPTLTFTQTSSSPLFGSKSALITKAASNSQGQGVAYPLTLDAGVSTITPVVQDIYASYQITAGTYSYGTSSTDSDLEAYIYDVTNAQVIQPSGYKFDGGLFHAQFQPNATSSSYRLCLHVATTSTSAWTMKIDNVQVVPQQHLYGMAASDWTSYTPTVAGLGTVTNLTAYYRKVGDTLEARGIFTAGSVPGGTQITVSLPSGLSIDSTKLPTSLYFNVGEFTGVIGTQTTVWPTNATGGGGPFIMISDPATDATKLYVGRGTSSNTLTKMTGDNNFVSGNTMEFNFKVPVVGWSSNQELSSNTDSRVIALITTGSPAAATAGNPIIFPTVTKDTHGAYNATTGRYTAPVPGFYTVSSFINSTILANAELEIYVNGSLYAGIGTGSTATGFLSGSGDVYANAGDLIDVRANQNTGTNSTSYMSIKRASGPSQVAASETVAVSYTRNANQTSIASGTATKIAWDTKVLDTHNAYVTDTWTCPVSGTYNVSGQIFWGSGSNFANGNEASLRVYKNGSEYARININLIQASVANVTNNGSVLMKLVAGDTIDFRAFQNTGSSQTIQGAAILNYFSIYRVGN